MESTQQRRGCPVDVRGVEPLSKQIISYTLYVLVNVPMISQNIRFKPFQVRSKTFLRRSWLITPLGDILCLRALKTWLKIYRNPHDTKILRGLYSAFLIHFAGFNQLFRAIKSPRYKDTHKTYCLIYCPNLLCGVTSLPLIVIRRYLMRMLIHSEIPSLPRLLKILYSASESMYVIRRYLYQKKN